MKSLILLSGGLDSLVNFKKALDETDVKLILTFDYGQASSIKEIEATTLISKKYSVTHRVIKLDFLSNINHSLKKGDKKIFDESKLDDFSYTKETAKSVWIPNRNGLFINIAASICEVENIDYIVVGFNKEEGKTFPDNTKTFIKRINSSLKFSTLYHPEVKCYTIDKVKKDIVKFGIAIKAPFEYLWSCYNEGEKMCGVCESCQRLKRALKQSDFYEDFLKINKWGFEK